MTCKGPELITGGLRRTWPPPLRSGGGRWRPRTPSSRPRNAPWWRIENTGIFSLENGRVDLPVYTDSTLKKLFESDGAASVDLFDTPFIVSQVPWFKALCEAGPLQAEVSSFRTVFDSSPNKVQTGRGAIKLQSQQLPDQISAQFVGMFRNGFEVKPTGAAEGSKLLQANLGLSMFGYAANTELAAMEKALLPCFRVGCAGTRMVAISRFTDVGEFVRQKTGQANNLTVHMPSRSGSRRPRSRRLWSALAAASRYGGPPLACTTSYTCRPGAWRWTACSTPGTTSVSKWPS